jgi:hypothetical protein
MRARELKNDLFVRKNKQNHEVRFYILNLLLNLPFINFTQQLKIYKILQKNTKLAISIKNNGISQTNTKTIFHTFRESRHIIRNLFYKKQLPGLQKGS